MKGGIKENARSWSSGGDRRTAYERNVRGCKKKKSLEKDYKEEGRIEKKERGERIYRREKLWKGTNFKGSARASRRKKKVRSLIGSQEDQYQKNAGEFLILEKKLEGTSENQRKWSFPLKRE